MSNEETKVVIDIRKTAYDVPYTVDNSVACETKFAFVLSGDVYTALENDAYLATKNKYNVVGFRRGKAPLHTIKSMYGPYVFLEEMIDRAVNLCYDSIYRNVIDTMRIAIQPDLEYGTCDDKQIAFTFVVVEYPVLENLTYKGLSVEKVQPQEISDEMVDNKLTAAREKAGYWQNVDDRAAKDGDTTVLDYAGTIDGVAFEGGTAEDQELVLGSHSFIDGFEDQMIGMNIGEERDLHVTFPADYGAEDLAGKEAVFHVKLKGLKVKVLPDADDEFAKDVSEYDTLADLKDSYRRELADAEEKRAKNATEQNLIDAVIKANPVELNNRIIESAADKRVGEFEQMLTKNGMTMDMYCEYTGVTRDKMKEDYMASSKESEIRSLVLTEVVKAEGLKVTPEEMENKIADAAAKAGKDVDEYKKSMQRDEFDYMYNTMLSDKLIDLLTEVNTIA